MKSSFENLFDISIRNAMKIVSKVKLYIFKSNIKFILFETYMDNRQSDKSTCKNRSKRIKFFRRKLRFRKIDFEYFLNTLE